MGAHKMSETVIGSGAHGYGLSFRYARIVDDAAAQSESGPVNRRTLVGR